MKFHSIFFVFFLCYIETTRAISGYKLNSAIKSLTFDLNVFTSTQVRSPVKELSATGPNATISWYWTPTSVNRLHQGESLPGSPTVVRGQNISFWNVGEESSADISDAPMPNPTGCSFQMKFNTTYNCGFSTDTVIYFVCDPTVAAGYSYMEFYAADLYLCNIQLKVRTNCTAWATPYSAPTTIAPTTVTPTTSVPTSSVAPTTQSATTILGTTSTPSTIVPTTESPSTTSEPTTLEPTASPTTVEPTTETPTTVEPTTELPTTESPTTELPTTLTPTTLLLTTTMPTTTVEPTTEIPSTSSPTTLTPTTLPPTTTTMPSTLPPTTEPPIPSTSNIIQSVNNTDSLSVFIALRNSADAFLRSNKESDSVETSKISISFQKVDTNAEDPIESSFKESEAKAVIPSSIISSISSQSVVVTFQMIQGNPFSQVNNVSVYSPVVGLSVGSTDGSEFPIQSTKEMINLTIPISSSLSPDQEYVCLYWSEEKQSWESDGLITSPSQSSQSTIVCSTSHLTNFTLGSKSKLVAQPAVLDSNTHSSSPLPTGAIIGIAVGGFVLIVVVVVLAFLALRTKKKNIMSTDIESIIELPQFDGLDIQSEIGKGAYGQVMLAIQSDSTRVAIKKLSQNGDSRLFYHEANQLSKLHHPNIVQFLRLNKNEQFFVMEYLPGGNLLNFIQKEGSLLTELQKLRMLKDLVNALAYLEEMKVVHRDVACRNVLMSQNDVSATLKLGDFGHSVEAGAVVPSYMTEKLPVRWSAPESFTSKTFFTSSDVWSFGVVVFEMFENGKIPYGQLSNEGVQALVSKGGRLDLFSVPPSLEQLVLRCWEQNPTKRPTFRKIGEEIQSMIKEMSQSPEISSSSTPIYRKPSQPELTSLDYEPHTRY